MFSTRMNNQSIENQALSKHAVRNTRTHKAHPYSRNRRNIKIINETYSDDEVVVFPTRFVSSGDALKNMLKKNSTHTENILSYSVADSNVPCLVISVANINLLDNGGDKTGDKTGDNGGDKTGDNSGDKTGNNGGGYYYSRNEKSTHNITYITCEAMDSVIPLADREFAEESFYQIRKDYRS